MTSKKSEPEASCVLLVEDSRELAPAMIRALKSRGHTVVHATSYTQAMVLIERKELRFDAAVLDHRLPDGDSRELVTALADREPWCCSSLVLTGYGDQELVRDYRVRGAFRYASKPITFTHLAALVDATIHDTKRWRREMSQGSGEHVPPVTLDIEHAADRLREIGELSQTETSVAYWMLQGLRDAEIAQKLGRAERTAKRHVSQVLAKLGVKNRASLWAVLHEDSESRRVDGHDDADDADDDDDVDDQDDEDDGDQSLAGSGHPGIAPGLGHRHHREDHLDPPHGAEAAHVKFAR